MAFAEYITFLSAVIMTMCVLLDGSQKMQCNRWFNDRFECICGHKCCNIRGVNEMENSLVNQSECESKEACHSNIDLYNTSLQLTDENCVLDTNLSIIDSHCSCTSGNESWVHVDLSNKKLEKLHPCVFAGLGELFPHLVSVDLSNNFLSEINMSNSGLEKLEVLALRNNSMKDLQPGMFATLAKLKILDVSQNQIKDMQNGLFKGLESLLGLFLQRNKLSSFNLNGTFSELGNLIYLDLRHNTLKNLHSGLFAGLKNLKKLRLQNITLEHIDESVFDDVSNLTYLYLSNNQLKTLKTGLHVVDHINQSVLDNNITNDSPGTFSELGNLIALDLSHNLLENLQSGLFKGLLNLKRLQLQNNAIKYIHQHVFDAVETLTHLDLSNNQLKMIETSSLEHIDQGVLDDATDATNLKSTISPGTFTELRNLLALDLSHNLLENLQPGLFEGLQSLHKLLLQHITVKHINEGVFDDVADNLTLLDLSNNQLKTMESGAFATLAKLQTLNLSNNSLEDIEHGLWPNTSAELKILDLRGNALTWIEDFNVLNKTVLVLVERSTLCCYFLNCTSSEQPVPFLTCKPLLQYNSLRVAVWVISILAIVANIFGMYSQYQRRAQISHVQYLMIMNLSVSDCLMGIYLIILLSADLYYWDSFPAQSDLWRDSSPCKIASTISVLSSEASVFFITLISIDRFTRVKYPLSKHQLKVKSTRVVLTMLWVLAITISVGSFILLNMHKFWVYSVSEVCIGLPIQRHQDYSYTVTDIQTIHVDRYTCSGRYKTHSWLSKTQKYDYKKGSRTASLYFSIAILTGLNLICFIVVGICYTYIFVRLRKSSKNSGLSLSKREIRLAKRLSLLVLTDFCCWVPIGILSILVQVWDVSVDPVAYVWIATFVLPINSSINPFLYTLGDVIADMAKKCRSSYRNASIRMRQLR